MERSQPADSPAPPEAAPSPSEPAESGSAPVSSGVGSRATIYVACVIAAAFVSAAIVLGREPLGTPRTIAVWAVAAAVSQLLTFPTLTGRGHVSLSTAVHLCMILVLGPGEFVPALALSRFAVAVVERKPWYRSLFNASQVVVAVLMGWLAYGAVAGTPRSEPTLENLSRPAVAFLASALTYYVFNVGAVSGILALTSGSSPIAAWRANYGHRHEAVGTIALVLLAPLVAVAYSTFGGIGLLAFLLPMLFLHDASARYVALRSTQESLLRSQRQAAKAEMAAEIGRDINNYLCVAQAQIQMLQLRKERLDDGEYEKRLQAAHEQLRHIDMLSRGLLDFARKESVIERVNLHELITNTVSFLQPQRRFNDVKVRLDLDAATGMIPADPRQLQQVLVNLLVQAAERMSKTASAGRAITIRLRACEARDAVEIAVSDTGPALPESVRRRMFDVGSEGPKGDVGLFIVHSIIRNHRGSISVEAIPEGGTKLSVILPCPREPAVRPRRLGLEHRLRSEPKAA
ncbi:MAG: sensor histidine kinase [Candidatus Eiseniibacteriota bacterium]